MKQEFFQVEQVAITEGSLPVKTTMTKRPSGQASIEKIAPSASRPAIYLGTAGPRAGQVYHYALHLAELLDARIYDISPDLQDLPPHIVENSDLLIYQEPQQSRFKTWFWGPPACRVVDRWPVSVLVVRQPHWPLKKMLLVTRGRRPDYTAVTWVIRLARPVQADITVLAVQPYLSTVNSRALYGEGMGTWLTSDTSLGQQLRHLVKALGTVAGYVDLQFRGGSPGRQIRQAVAETQPDLIVIACEPVSWWERRILGDLVRPLLRRADCPVLVAKS